MTKTLEQQNEELRKELEIAKSDETIQPVVELFKVVIHSAVILTILFMGEPDLIDGLIKFLMR